MDQFISGGGGNHAGGAVRQSHDSYGGVGGGGQLNLNLKQRMNYHFANQPQ